MVSQLPSNIKLQKDVISAISKSASVFINYLGQSGLATSRSDMQTTPELTLARLVLPYLPEQPPRMSQTSSVDLSQPQHVR